MNKYLLLGAVVAGLLVGGWIRGMASDAAIADIKAVHAIQLKTISDAALEKQTRLKAELDAKNKQFTEAETKHYEELRHAETQIDQLRADVDAGRQRLLIKARCPVSSDRLPDADTRTSMDYGDTAELDPALRSDYYALRNGIERITKQLAACQDRLRLNQ